MFLLKVALALIPIRSQYTPAGRLSRFSSGKNRPALAFSGTLSRDIGSGPARRLRGNRPSLSSPRSRLGRGDRRRGGWPLRPAPAQGVLPTRTNLRRAPLAVAVSPCLCAVVRCRRRATSSDSRTESANVAAPAAIAKQAIIISLLYYARDRESELAVSPPCPTTWRQPPTGLEIRQEHATRPAAACPAYTWAPDPRLRPRAHRALRLPR